ncbi:MAG: DUF2007 domain-containing protein [Verrucomicrobia bacterium]|nr:DUF2007 domain-containing protein [Verrucomicrobiota bacterium]MBI3869096.1 DUF2007 domain-containing protein [Verrucomicrobiota bacterium]
MKRIYSTPENARIGLIRGLLEAAGIGYEIRNEGISQAIPGILFMPEIWILRDEDEAESKEIIQSILSSGQDSPPEESGQ